MALMTRTLNNGLQRTALGGVSATAPISESRPGSLYVSCPSVVRFKSKSFKQAALPHFHAPCSKDVSSARLLLLALCT